jgi:hypothetical protein
MSGKEVLMLREFYQPIGKLGTRLPNPLRLERDIQNSPETYDQGRERIGRRKYHQSRREGDRGEREKHRNEHV